MISSADATHTTDAGHLYRIVRREKSILSRLWRAFCVLDTGVEFWDVNYNKWRPSVVRQKDLKPLEEVF